MKCGLQGEFCETSGLLQHMPLRSRHAKIAALCSDRLHDRRVQRDGKMAKWFCWSLVGEAGTANEGVFDTAGAQEWENVRLVGTQERVQRYRKWKGRGIVVGNAVGWARSLDRLRERRTEGREEITALLWVGDKGGGAAWGAVLKTTRQTRMEASELEVFQWSRTPRVGTRCDCQDPD